MVLYWLQNDLTAFVIRKNFSTKCPAIGASRVIRESDIKYKPYEKKKTTVDLLSVVFVELQIIRAACGTDQRGTQNCNILFELNKR